MEPKTITYYLKRGPNVKNPDISVVIAKRNSNMSRGVALRSPLDSFNKKRGRSIAMGRAMKALNSLKTCHKNRIACVDAHYKTMHDFENKCEFNPKFSKYEKSLIEKYLA